MPIKKKKLGDFAESLVAKYLKDKGFKIIERNYRKPWGEIDIVVKNKKSILFVEVKSQEQTGGGGFNFKPEDHFNYRKKQRLIRICKTYLLANNYLEDMEYRIDLAAVEVNFILQKAKLRYYKNVVEEL